MYIRRGSRGSMEAARAAPSHLCCEQEAAVPQLLILPGVALTSVHIDGLLLSISVRTVPITIFIIIT